VILIVTLLVNYILAKYLYILSQMNVNVKCVVLPIQIPHACLSKTGITEECLYDVSSVASSLSGDMAIAAYGGTEPRRYPTISHGGISNPSKL